jgi:cytochrome c oxidase accessory protein FixG
MKPSVPIAEETESFRDSVSTISKEGKRNWIYPKRPAGRHYRARTWVSVVLLALLFGLPFVEVNGHPFMLFNVLERKFIVFGLAFWPQDFFLFVLAMLTFIVFIILFTALFGRLFCGWTCPQTIFMEMVFRKIEYLIEGDYQKQKALHKAPMSPQKAFRKGLKHAIFFLVSFLIANTFLAYLIGLDELKKIVTDDPADHAGGLVSITLFTLVLYGVYARFREQVCLVVCPYGRLQGVLLDPRSVVIAYDYGRGEPRGVWRKNEERTAGDCIDCHQCVQVCPTGIDIRNGTQLECVNCTACIDACDAIMDRIGKPRGLVRYASEQSIARKEKFKITPRVIGYSALLGVLLTVLVTLLAVRTDVEATVLRTPGMLYQRLDGGKVSNLYNVKIVNKTFRDLPVEIELDGVAGEIRWIGRGIETVKEDALAEGEFFIILDKKDIRRTRTELRLRVLSGGEEVDRLRTAFLGPT